MARPVAALLAAGTFLLLAGCQSSSTPAAAPARPTAFTVTQLHLKLRVPAELADLTYAMGTSGEGKPAANFSTKLLTGAGGPACAAGAKNSVSPFPIGQIVLSPETPEHVAQEAKDNPEELLGDFVKQLGSSYLYYVAPPAESCAPKVKKVADLQRRATTALRAALQSVEVAG